MATTTKRTKNKSSLTALRAEVTRLRRDVDLLGMQRVIDELLMRVSRLETTEEQRAT